MTNARSFSQMNYKKDYEQGYADAKAKYAPKWTMMEDGFPEENHAVLVYCPEYNNTYIALLVHCDSNEDGEWYFWYYYTQGASRKITEDVIAWMPIPEYEEDKSCMN